eukprot:TRINITY_DN43_c0_g1_i1.p1 TRINITY_DN43_c0_g1~~TRINITY_DN43_c0_g1_i1.p1  ORF type:complete len:160 (-),score=28.45 TRINITY_DN43_c0_g1_i1:298-777(-)
MAEVQNEKAFQKQIHMNQQSKQMLKSKTGKGVRFWKNIGLGFKTPREAIEQKYIDKKCPFTSDVSIRGKIVKGILISKVMQKTIIIRRDYLHYVQKYNRYEKRHRNIPVHCSPCFPHIKQGDIIIAGQCRPLSKTVRFNVIKVIPNEIVGNIRKEFVLF